MIMKVYQPLAAMVNARYHVEEWNNVLVHVPPSVHLAEMETVN